jgi:MinD-like ATPase involved in chromosome partitioning or flagellar assembly
VNRALTKANVQLRQKTYILNQITAEAQLPQATVERGLNARTTFQIGYDPNQMRALAQGVPLALTSAKSPLPTAINRMAEAIWQRVAKKGG